MLESKIEQESVKAADNLGFWGVKLLSSLIKGLPDRMFLGHGGVVFIEYKQPGKTLSKMQVYIHKKFEKYGITVHVAYSVEDTIRILTHAIK